MITDLQCSGCTLPASSAVISAGLRHHCGGTFESIAPDAPVPPASGLSDERLAEIRDRWMILQPAERTDALHDLLAEIARTRSDAALGAAVREALATLNPSDFLCVEPPSRNAEVWIDRDSDAAAHTDATRALAALLHASPDQTERTTDADA